MERRNNWTSEKEEEGQMARDDEFKRERKDRKAKKRDKLQKKTDVERLDIECGNGDSAGTPSSDTLRREIEKENEDEREKLRRDDGPPLWDDEPPRIDDGIPMVKSDGPRCYDRPPMRNRSDGSDRWDKDDGGSSFRAGCWGYAPIRGYPGCWRVGVAQFRGYPISQRWRPPPRVDRKGPPPSLYDLKPWHRDGPPRDKPKEQPSSSSQDDEEDDE